MRVALLTTFAASRKEPLVAMMDRVHQAFVDAGLGEPVIRFNFGDPPLAGYVSSIDRVLKRHPELERFVTTAARARQYHIPRCKPSRPAFPGRSRSIRSSSTLTRPSSAPFRQQV
jgi:hypothetical protein